MAYTATSSRDVMQGEPFMWVRKLNDEFGADTTSPGGGPSAGGGRDWPRKATITINVEDQERADTILARLVEMSGFEWALLKRSTDC